MLNTALLGFTAGKFRPNCDPSVLSMEQRWGARPLCGPGQGAGGGCGPRVFSVNGTPGLCMQDALAFLVCTFYFWLRMGLDCSMGHLWFVRHELLVQHVVSSSPTRDQNQVPGIGSSESCSHWATRKSWYVLLKPCFPSSFFPFRLSFFTFSLSSILNFYIVIILLSS